MHQQRFFIVLLVFFASYNTSFSQDGYTVVTRDLEAWYSAGIKYKPGKKLSIDFEQGWRLNQNASATDQILTDFGIKWKPIKPVYFGLGLRYIKDRGGNDLFDNDFRFNLDAGVKHKVDRFTFNYRLRFQNRNEIGLSTAEGDYFKNYFRLKLAAAYNIKNWKLDPKISTEVFRDMTRYTGGFNNFRVTIGTDYSLKQFGKISAFYRMERDLGSTYPKTTNIIGLGYTFTINTKK